MPERMESHPANHIFTLSVRFCILRFNFAGVFEEPVGGGVKS
jgi:hypothetical protein